MMKNRASVFVSLLALLAVVSCQGPVTNFAPAAKAAGSGRVTVAIPTPGRTVVADPAAATYTVTLTSHDGLDAINLLHVQSTAEFTAVPAGTWDVDVTAYNADNDVIGLGSLVGLDALEVTDGNSYEVTVPVTTTQTGTGGFSFTFNIPASTAVNAVSAQLYDADDGAVGPPLVPTLAVVGSDLRGTVANASLASGAYRLALTFRRGGAAGTVAKVDTEAVNVFDNLTSDLWLTSAGTLQETKDYTAADFSVNDFSTVAALQGWTGPADFRVVKVVSGSAGSFYALYNTTTASHSGDFGNGVVTVGTTSAVIVQYDSNHLALQAYELNFGEISGFDVDADGNLFLVGGFDGGTVVLGTDTAGDPYPVTGFEGSAPLLVKMNPQGRVVWAKSTVVAVHVDSGFGWSDWAWYNDVRVYGTGVSQVVDVVGEIDQASTYDFGDGILVHGSPLYNSLVIQYGASGQALWARSQAATGGDIGAYLNTITLDTDGNLYAIGILSGPGDYTFDGAAGDPGLTVTLATPPESYVLVKYSASGTPLWAAAAVSSPSVSFNRIAIDSQGQVYAVGSIGGGTTDFGAGVTLSTTAGTSPVLVKYSPEGTALWAKSTDLGDRNGVFHDVVLGAAGEVFVAATISGNTALAFGGHEVTPGSTGSSALVLRYDASGQAEWARVANPASGNSSFNALAVDAAGRVMAAGNQYGAGEYGYGGGVTVTGPGAGFNPLFVQYQ